MRALSVESHSLPYQRLSADKEEVLGGFVRCVSCVSRGLWLILAPVCRYVASGTDHSDVLRGAPWPPRNPGQQRVATCSFAVTARH